MCTRFVRTFLVTSPHYRVMYIFCMYIIFRDSNHSILLTKIFVINFISNFFFWYNWYLYLQLVFSKKYCKSKAFYRCDEKYLKKACSIIGVTKNSISTWNWSWYCHCNSIMFYYDWYFAPVGWTFCGFRWCTFHFQISNFLQF